MLVDKKVTTVVCDGCGKRFPEHFPQGDVAEAMHAIRHEGWVSFRDKEYCDGCVHDLLSDLFRLREAVEDLLQHGACYRSAIELNPDFNGEDWELRVRTILGLLEGGADA